MRGLVVFVSLDRGFESSARISDCYFQRSKRGVGGIAHRPSQIGYRFRVRRNCRRCFLKQDSALFAAVLTHEEHTTAVKRPKITAVLLFALKTMRMTILASGIEREKREDVDR